MHNQTARESRPRRYLSNSKRSTTYCYRTLQFMGTSGDKVGPVLRTNNPLEINCVYSVVRFLSPRPRSEPLPPHLLPKTLIAETDANRLEHWSPETQMRREWALGNVGIGQCGLLGPIGDRDFALVASATSCLIVALLDLDATVCLRWSHSA